jgi:Protein of unknown function (DUF3631)
MPTPAQMKTAAAALDRVLGSTNNAPARVKGVAVPGEVVAQEIDRLLARFISYPSEQCRTAHVFWILHTHLLQHFEFTPRLAFLSPEPASGKTRALEITERLVPNPVCAVNMSPAYLFRKVGSGDETVTILFDEIDTVFGPKAKENEEIRGLLNAGHHRGAVAGRCVVKGKNIETEELPAFAPVALAGIGWLPDTILTRCIVVRMQRRAAGEIVEPYRRRIHDADTNRVRGLVEVWAGTVWPDGITWPELPAGIQDRDADVWEPLIAIADAVGGEWPAKVREAAVTLVTAGKDREPSLGIRLLTDLHQVFDGHDQMFTTTILEELHDSDEAPWADIRGKPLNDRGLAHRLNQYGIKSKTIRLGTTAKGYVRADFLEAWSRYLPPSADRSVTSVTKVTNGATPAATVTDVTLVTHLSGHRGEGDKCQQCGRSGETIEMSRAGIDARLHRDCIDSWIANFDDAGLVPKVPT